MSLSVAAGRQRDTAALLSVSGGRGFKMTLRSPLVSVLALAAALLPAAAGAQARLPTTVVLHNGRIVTQDGEDRTVSALAVVGDRVVSAGADSEVLALRASATCVVDLKGRTVVPGFADSHLHSKISQVGDNVVDLTPVRSMAELLDALKAKVAASRPGDLIITNSDWHEAQLKELRLPTRWDMDPISPTILSW